MSEEGGEGGGHGAVWLVSYADMVTLLLAFFVVMYTMSQVDAEKLKKLVMSMHSAFSPTYGDSGGVIGSRKVRPGTGGLVLGGHITPQTAPPLTPSAGRGEVKGVSRASHDLASVADGVRVIAKEMKVEKQLKTKVSGRGVVISLEESATSSGSLVPFESGSAALLPGFRRLLDRLAPVLKDLTNKIEVQGHTDRRPIRTAAFPSNWELSGARAGSVVRYLVQHHGLRRRQFVCSGFADTVPVAHGDNPNDWARNRRIEIVVTRQPIDNYDSMTRADALTQQTDITGPIQNPVFTGLPEPRAEAAATQAAP
ncbi:MAG: flagellar motor protein MotB, partial [Armatimonadetes bacterium]|nr:flagellar motor protein MotB [Armatimonadota bacterium]